MADTTSAAPSDAEIDAQWRESVAKHETTAAFVRDFARAVLARWGAPHPVAREPMSEEFLEMMRPHTSEPASFSYGIRFAEAHHGIGTEKGDSNGLPT